MNKTFKTLGKAILSLTAVALVFSCAKEVPGNEVKEGFSVQMGVTVPEFVSVNTKVISESAIKDVTVLEFKAGTLINQFTLSDQIFTSGALDIAANFDTDAKKALPAANLNEETNYLVKDGSENIMVFLANFSCNSIVPSLVVGTSKYSDFLTASMAFADANALANAEYVPMYGTWTQGLSAGATNHISVALTPVMSYINFTVNTTNFTAPAGQTLVGSPTISNMVLHNAPLGVTLPHKAVRPEKPVNNANGIWYEKAADGGYNAHSFVAGDVYPTTGLVDVNETLEATQTNNTTGTSFQFYFNETCQGSESTITTFEEKAAVGDAENANRPYITFDLTYTTDKGSSMVYNYKVNLGGNNTGDFNLLGGVKYNVTTYVYGAKTSTYISFDDDASFNLESVAAAGGYTLLPLANCYILPTGAAADATKVLPLTQALAGWKYIQANDGSGLDYVTALKALIEAGSYTVETEWQTIANGSAFNPSATAPTNADHLSGAASTYKYFPILSIPAVSATNGSALVVLKATADQAPFANNDILWSWHLWFTNYNPDSVDGSAIVGQGVVTAVTNGETHRYKGGAFAAGGSYPTGLGMMDRNLGATYDASTTAIKDAYASISAKADANFRALRGMYYQFGRPAPFPMAAASDDANGIETAVAYTKTGAAYTFVNEVDASQTPHQKDAATNGSDLKYATLHPTHFISNQTIWNDAQTTSEAWPEVMDPSPAGWSLPKGSTSELVNVWWDFGTGENKYDSAVWGNIGASYEVATGTRAYYPASGNVNRTTGKFYNVGSYGYYWSQTPTSNTYGRSLIFNSTALNRSNNYNRAYAFPVRCVQD